MHAAVPYNPLALRFAGSSVKEGARPAHASFPRENRVMAENSDTTPDPLKSDFDAEDAYRAAHATEPGLGSEGEADDEIDTVTGNAIDSDDGETFPASKPVPADGEGPLP
jgi:hypothetical protein